MYVFNRHAAGNPEQLETFLILIIKVNAVFFFVCLPVCFYFIISPIRHFIALISNDLTREFFYWKLASK